MNRRQRTIVIPVTLALILLSAAVGTLLGTVSSHDWDMLLARIQGGRVNTVAPASNARATLYVLDASQPTTREVVVDLRVSGPGYDSSLASVPILLTAEKNAVEMPINDELVLRMELMPGISYLDDEPAPSPPVLPLQVAERRSLP